MQNQSDFKILSLSGGGYRGLYTAEVLKELENYLKNKNHILQQGVKTPC